MEVGSFNNQFDRITQDGKVDKQEYKDLKVFVQSMGLPEDQEKSFIKLIDKTKDYSKKIEFAGITFSDGLINEKELFKLVKLAQASNNPLANEFLNSFLSKAKLGGNLEKTEGKENFNNNVYESNQNQPSKTNFQINKPIYDSLPNFSFLDNNSDKNLDYFSNIVSSNSQSPISKLDKESLLNLIKSSDLQFDHFSDLVKSNGGEVDLSPGKKNIVSIRIPTDPKANKGKGLYDDQTIVFWVDKEGKKNVEKFESNTDPSAQFAGSVRKDQGRIRAGGTNKFKVGSSGKLGKVLRPVDNVTVDRYYNGQFKEVNSGNKSFLFHAGGSNSTGSAGCQTMKPGDFNQFWSAINSDGNPGEINYTIVETSYA